MNKKVLIVTSTMHIGGAEYMVANLCKASNKKKIQIEVCWLKQGGMVAEELNTSGVKVSSLGSKKSNCRSDYFTSIPLSRFIKKSKFEIIHSHDMHSFIDCCICRIINPSIRHVHTFHFGNYQKRNTKYLLIEKFLWKIPDKLVAVGRNQRDSIERFVGIPKNKIEVVWNGVEKVVKTELHPKIKELKSQGHKIIGSVCTLIEQKGIFTLIDAVAKLARKRNDFILVIVGEGYLRKSLEEKVKANGISNRVFLVGWIPNACKTAIAGFDLFIQTSLWEAMSLVIIEAMAAGIPVIATRVGENPYVLCNGEFGILIDPGKNEQAAKAIELLLDNPYKRKILGEAASRRYEQAFSANAMAKRYEVIYEEILKKKSL